MTELGPATGHAVAGVLPVLLDKGEGLLGAENSGDDRVE
jgi:hypothetical protein